MCYLRAFCFNMRDQLSHLMSILVFQPNGAKSKHGSIAVDGRCFRFNRANVRGYAQEFRCCDSKCPARVLFNSPDDFVVSGDHWACAFDHRRELRSRMRLTKAYEVLQQNLTDPIPKIIEKVQLLIDDEMTAAERHALKTFISAKRIELLGRQSKDANELVVPDHLRVTSTPVSPEHPDNSFLLYDSNEHEQDAPSRILIFASADMRFKASMATELFADGTYRIVPHGFATLYTIHALVKGVPYPVFFCLTQEERRETFTRVLNVVKPYLTKFDESCVVHTDCQRSAIDAFKRTFGCKVKLCLFHINQALWRYVSKVGLAAGYNDTARPRLHAWIRRLMAFPFMKSERMTACFRECFETMAVDDVLGVEEEYRDKFREVVAYYRRFWLEEIGPELICQYDEANRTNNHAEAFHRGIGCAVQVAHPQTLVLIQLLVNVERDAMLRFDTQRSGKDVQPRDKRLDDLETSIVNTMKSFDEGLFRNDSEYLSAIAKLYVEYNHKIKTARLQNSTALVRRVAHVRDAVMKALDNQNLVVFGEAPTDDAREDDEDERVFVEADFNTEIIFDATQLCEGQQVVVHDVECQVGQETDVPMEICTEVVSEKRRHETKPAVSDDKTSTPVRRRRRTLIQRMKGKR